MSKKSKRICLVATSGGHTTQLLRLADCWKNYEIFSITTTAGVRDELRRYGTIYIVGECNRTHPWRVLTVLFQCIKPIWRERPDVVISTGAAVGCLTCWIAKMLGAKLIWIDSITNVEKISLSGKLIKCFTSLFLVQWPALTKKYKNVEYVGEVI